MAACGSSILSKRYRQTFQFIDRQSQVTSREFLIFDVLARGIASAEAGVHNFVTKVAIVLIATGDDD